MSELYFCFTAYEDNEQLEPGDTISHTFLKPDWPYCTTKYFYFWGSQAGIVCKSTSPPFSYHNAYVAPPVTCVLFQATTASNYIRSNASSWAATWNGSLLTVGDFYGPPLYLIETSAYLTASYWIYRAYLYYDTSDLPDDKTIASADFIFWPWEIYSWPPDRPYQYLTRGLQHTPLVTTDWIPQNTEIEVLAQMSRYDMTPDSQNTIPLNSAGLAHINKTGITRFCFRHQKDVENSPSWTYGASGFYFHSAQDPTPAHRPWLRVCYYS